MTNQIVGSVDTIHTCYNFESEFEWKINNFCCMGCKNVGDRLTSPTFVTKVIDGNVEWFMVYEKEESSKDSLSLYLYCKKGDVKAEGSFIICNSNKKVLKKYFWDEKLFNNGTGWGSPDIISRSSIKHPENGILDDGKLTVICKIKFKSEVKFSISYFDEEQENEEVEDVIVPQLEDNYEALLTSSKYGDVSLISEGKIIKVYAGILSQNSSVFEAMFDTEMKEKQDNSIDISDVKYDVLLEMCRFIYAGRVNNVDSLAGDLAIAADKYALNGLKIKCEKTMIENLSLENVLECLQIAERIRMDNLKKKTIEFIVNNANKIAEKPNEQLALLPNEVFVEIFRGMTKKIKYFLE